MHTCLEYFFLNLAVVFDWTAHSPTSFCFSKIYRVNLCVCMRGGSWGSRKSVWDPLEPCLWAPPLPRLAQCLPCICWLCCGVHFSSCAWSSLYLQCLPRQWITNDHMTSPSISELYRYICWNYISVVLPPPHQNLPHRSFSILSVRCKMSKEK